MPRALAILGLTTFLLAPFSLAQSPVCGVISLTCGTTVTVTVPPPEAPLAPGVAVSLPLKVEYVYTEYAPNQPGPTITLNVTTLPSWLGATLEPAAFQVAAGTVPCGCGKTVHLDGKLVLVARTTVAQRSPASLQLTVRASATEDSSASEGNTSVPVEAIATSRGNVTAAALPPLSGGPDLGTPLLAALVGVGILGVAALGVLAARRRRARQASP